MPSEFATVPAPREVATAPKSMRRWPGHRGWWSAAVVFPALFAASAEAGSAGPLVFGAVTGLALLGAAWSRWSHARLIEPFLRDGSWCVATTEHSATPLTSSGFGFRYVAPNDVPYEAAVRFSGRPLYLDTDSATEERTPSKVQILVNPDDFADGYAFVPGCGLVPFRASALPTGRDVGFAGAELEARLPSPGLALYKLPNFLLLLLAGVVGFLCFMAIMAVPMGLMFLVGGGPEARNEVLYCAVMSVLGPALAFWLKRRSALPTYAFRGTDGVRLSDDFIPFADIATVQSNTLQLNNGQTRVFHGDGHAIRRLHHAYRETEDTQLPRAFARKGQSFVRWAQQLAGKLGAAHKQGYRDELLREEDLWSVLENPRAPKDERAGAAIALAQNSSDDRLRIAKLVETTASPKLRRLFELSAQHEEAALAEEAQTLGEELAALDESVASMR